MNIREQIYNHMLAVRMSLISGMDDMVGEEKEIERIKFLMGTVGFHYGMISDKQREWEIYDKVGVDFWGQWSREESLKRTIETMLDNLIQVGDE